MKKILSKITLAAALTACFLLLTPTAEAQLHVAADGEVGIGTTNPIGRLNINNNNAVSYYSIRNVHSYTGGTVKYGLYNYVTSAGTGAKRGIYNLTYGNTGATQSHYGLYNYGYTYTSSTAYGQYNSLNSYGGNGARYALYNRIYCNSNDGTGARYALYSTVSGCSGAYAGYFAGDVYISGTLTTTSDASKKTNIQDLNGALALVSQLEPKKYDYINDDDLALPEEEQFGFLAQDLEKVLPQLVKDVETYTEDVAEPKDGEEPTHPVKTGDIKTVNYLGLIPILVEAIQEQQATIEELKQKVEQLEQGND